MLRFFYPFLLFRAFVCQHPLYILPSCWSLVLSENKNCWAQLPPSFPPRRVCSDPGNGRFFCSSFLNCFSLSGTKASQGTRSSLSEPKDFQGSYEYQISCRACMCDHGTRLMLELKATLHTCLYQIDSHGASTIAGHYKGWPANLPCQCVYL